MRWIDKTLLAWINICNSCNVSLLIWLLYSPGSCLLKLFTWSLSKLSLALRKPAIDQLMIGGRDLFAFQQSPCSAVGRWLWQGCTFDNLLAVFTLLAFQRVWSTARLARALPAGGVRQREKGTALMDVVGELRLTCSTWAFTPLLVLTLSLLSDFPSLSYV